jgi:hypothetical protein
MRERLGAACQIAGLIIMPLAIYEGVRDGGSFGTEILIGFVGFLAIVIGRGLRGAGRPK